MTKIIRKKVNLCLPKNLHSFHAFYYCPRDFSWINFKNKKELIFVRNRILFHGLRVYKKIPHFFL